jgi:hypothetical protein
MTPREYLEKFCKINNRRNLLYKRVFDKHKDNEGELPYKVREEHPTIIRPMESVAFRDD